MSCSVLLVDDDPTALKYVGTYLERSGYEVHYAGDGQSGLESYETHCQDVIIFDLELADMSGLEVPERLNTTNKCAIS